MGCTKCGASLILLIFNMVDLIASLTCAILGIYVVAKHYAPPWVYIVLFGERSLIVARERPLTVWVDHALVA